MLRISSRSWTDCSLSFPAASRLRRSFPGKGNICDRPTSFPVISSSRKDQVRVGRFVTPILAFGSSRAPARITAFSFMRIRSCMEARDGFFESASSM